MKLLAFVLAAALSWQYSAALSTCDVTFKKMGCHLEDVTDNSANLINDRNNIDWKHWEDGKYPLDLACRCNSAAKKAGYPYFALRFYGLCVGLKEIKTGSFKNCLGYAFDRKCNDDSDEICIGQDYADYVYEIGVDGGFGKWSDWSGCSASCGDGEQSRTRKCNSPSVRGNGKPCVGLAEEKRSCKLKECPVDGKFTPWTDYGKCSASCEGGTQTRSRSCTNPAPAHGGKDCVGPKTESRPCNTQKCPVDGGFTDWSTFGPCSQSCGGGSMKSTRTCTNPKPSDKGKDCEGPRERFQPCKNDLCPGPAGLAKASEIVDKFLKGFYTKTYPGTIPSAKFLQAIFEIQKAVREEFVSVDPTVAGKTLDQRLEDLKKFLKTATDGGSIDFARSLLGKSLFVFMKKKIKEGLPLDTLGTAAAGYLESIKKDIGDKKFSEMVSSMGDATLMFVIDTTGSMADEINAAKAIANRIIDQTRKFDVDYILSPFGDPGYGPTIYKPNTERAGFVQSIGGLKAAGGGDCPELSFTGMLEAFRKGPRYGSPMFVFTDASAKDDTVANQNALEAAARRSHATINFFTNLNGCGKGISSYEILARKTSGNVFPLKNEAEITKFTKYVQSSLQSDTILTSGGTMKSSSRRRRAIPAGYEHTFLADDSVGTIIVSLAVSNAGTADGVTLFDPSGKVQGAIASLSYAKVYEVPNPAFGKWKLLFPKSVGRYEYNIKAISKKPVVFDHSFLFQENPKRNSPPYAMSNPLTGRDADLLVQVGGIEHVKKDSLKINILDEVGNYLKQNIPIALFAHTDDIFTTKFTPPDKAFRVELSGTTNSGNVFQRVAREEDKAGKAFLRTLFAGHEYTVKLNERGAKIEIFIVNTGSEEQYTVEASSDVGKVSPASQTVSVRTSSYISLTFDAPREPALKGKTATITVNAIGKTSGSKIADSFTVLLVD